MRIRTMLLLPLLTSLMLFTSTHDYSPPPTTAPTTFDLWTRHDDGRLYAALYSAENSRHKEHIVVATIRKTSDFRIAAAGTDREHLEYRWEGMGVLKSRRTFYQWRIYEGEPPNPKPRA